MTDEPREVFLIRVWISHRNLPVDNIVQVDSDVTGRAWVLENKLRQEDARVRAMYEGGTHDRRWSLYHAKRPSARPHVAPERREEMAGSLRAISQDRPLEGQE